MVGCAGRDRGIRYRSGGSKSVILQPKLLGDKIGLHPVAVIFAVLAGGHLFWSDGRALKHCLPQRSLWCF